MDNFDAKIVLVFFFLTTCALIGGIIYFSNSEVPTMTRIGDSDCQGAIFVYKDDGTELDATKELSALNIRFPITGEIHSVKSEFLGGLQNWNRRIDDPSNAFLCVYAHMGEPGLCCVEDDIGRLVTWEELADSLPNEVEVLWLVGCESSHSMRIWSNGKNPARHFLVATAESKYFLPLVPLFRYEISIDPLFYFDEMPIVLDYKNKDISSVTAYNERDGNGFKPFVTNKTLNSYLEDKINRL